MLQTFYHTIPGSHFFPFSFLQSYLINSLFSYPFGFHLYALVLHAISCLLATIIIFKITKSKLISVLTVSLWTVHPLNVETLTRLVCAPAHVPAGALCLAFMLCFLMLADTKSIEAKKVFSLLGSVFFLISITSYEQYIFFPVVLFFIFNASYKEKYLMQIALIYFIYLIWRFIACGGSLLYSGDEFISWTAVGSLKDIFFRAFWLAPQLLVHYLKLFFWPDFLSESKADWYTLGDSVFSLYSLFCQIVILFILLSAFKLRKKIPGFTLGIVWFFVSMLPVVQIIPLFSIVDEHYCYLPILGIFLSVFSLVNYFFKSTSPRILIFLAIALFCLLSWRTYLYLPSARDELSQVIYRAKEAPPWIKPLHMVRALNIAIFTNRANVLPVWINERSCEEEVTKWLRNNLNAKPNFSHFYGPIQMPYNYNLYPVLCLYLYRKEAINDLGVLMKQALAVKNDSYGWYKNAKFLSEVREWIVAWRSLEKAVELNPRLALLYDQMFVGIAYNASRFNDAETLIQNYIKLKPNSSHPYLILGLLYKQFGKTPEALESYNQAISRDKIPSINYKDLYLEATDFFVQNHMTDQAKRALDIVARFDPFDKEVKQTLVKLNNLR